MAGTDSKGTCERPLVDSTNAVFEHVLLDNPHSVETWCAYVRACTEHKVSHTCQFVVYERAVRELPGSYKLWHGYLRDRVQWTLTRHPRSSAWRRTGRAFERALLTIHKYPRIWSLYLSFLESSGRVSQLIPVVNRALRSLAVGQHARLWPQIMGWVQQIPVTPLVVHLTSRYATHSPEVGIQALVNYLLEAGVYDEAARWLVRGIQDPTLRLRDGAPRATLWLQLAHLAAAHPTASPASTLNSSLRQGYRFHRESASLFSGRHLQRTTCSAGSGSGPG